MIDLGAGEAKQREAELREAEQRTKLAAEVCKQKETLNRDAEVKVRLAVEEVNIEVMVSVFVQALNRVTAGSLPAA